MSDITKGDAKTVALSEISDFLTFLKSVESIQWVIKCVSRPTVSRVPQPPADLQCTSIRTVVVRAFKRRGRPTCSFLPFKQGEISEIRLTWTKWLEVRITLDTVPPTSCSFSFGALIAIMHRFHKKNVWKAALIKIKAVQRIGTLWSLTENSMNPGL